LKVLTLREELTTRPKKINGFKTKINLRKEPEGLKRKPMRLTKG